MTPASTADLQILERLAGEPIKRIVFVNGEQHEIVIRQIKTGKIPKLVKACGSMIYAVTKPSNDPFNAAGLILVYTEECLDTLAVLLERERSFVDDLELDDSINLLNECLEVNIDFFVQRVLPSLFGAIHKVALALKARGLNIEKLAGMTPPSTSSQPGTGSPTSGPTPTASSSSTSKPQ